MSQHETGTPQEPDAGSPAGPDTAPAFGLANVPTVITSPTKAFADLMQRPRLAWLGPMIVVTLLTVAATWIMLPQTVEMSYEMAQRTMDRLGVPEAEQVEALAEMPLEPTGAQVVRQVLSNVVIAPLILLIVAALLHVAVRMFGGRPSFGLTLSMLCLSNVILAIGTLIFAFLVSGADTMDVTLGPGALIPDLDLYSPLGIFLDTLNVFALWYLFVLVKGIRGVAGVSDGTAWGIGVTYWVIRALFVASGKIFVAWSRGG